MGSQIEAKHLIVVNTAGSLVSDIETPVMINAIALGLIEVCKAWNLTPNIKLSLWNQMIAAGESAQSDAVYYFLIDDHQNTADVLRAHSKTRVRVGGIVSTKQIFAASGVTIDADGKRPSVAAALFKTIAESLINPAGNLWWRDPACGEFIAGKICDPVMNIPMIVTLTVAQKEEKFDELLESKLDEPKLQSNEPEKSAEPTKFNVALCDFVLPAWSDAASDDSRFDILGVLKSPFEVATGGCTQKYEPPSGLAARLNFDRRVPQWQRDSRKVQVVIDSINVRIAEFGL